ncbi:MAG: DUF1778 domain-containing protein [Acidobacteriota bacterium]|nr:DUF1778 domain-containing protein [Acidobacteriota bacterium]
MRAQAKKPHGKEPAAKPYRFDARLNESQKLLIQRAADLEGRTLTDFVLHSAESAAERTIQERTMLVLSAKDTEAFVQALLAPAPEPGPALRRAAKRYKERLGL